MKRHALFYELPDRYQLFGYLKLESTSRHIINHSRRILQNLCECLLDTTSFKVLYLFVDIFYTLPLFFRIYSDKRSYRKNFKDISSQDTWIENNFKVTHMQEYNVKYTYVQIQCIRIYARWWLVEGNSQGLFQFREILEKSGVISVTIELGFRPFADRI